MKPPTSFVMSFLLPAFYRDAKRFQAILTCVNSLTIFQRNKRSVDVLYSVVLRISHRHAPPSSKIFSERIPDPLAKGKHSHYTNCISEKV